MGLEDGTVSGMVLQAADGQLADMIRVQDSNGKPMFRVGATGDTHVRTDNNSAFSVQNTAGADVLNVDTVNQHISIGSVGIVSGQQVSFSNAVSSALGYNPSITASADLNDDGRKDVVVGGATQVFVLLSNGDGTFQNYTSYSIGAYSTGIAIADVNGDNIPDILVTHYNTADGSNGAVSVLLGNGDGTFQTHIDRTLSGGLQSIATSDVNDDGKPDILAADLNSSGTLRVLLGNGDGTFQPEADFTTHNGANRIAISDFNGDGKPDVLTAGNTSACLLLGNGDGTFQLQSSSCHGNDYGSTGYIDGIGDINGDGIPDILNYDNNGKKVETFLGSSDGTFRAGPYYKLGINQVASIIASDVSGDGKPDILITNSNSPATLSTLLNVTTGFGTYASGSSLSVSSKDNLTTALTLQGSDNQKVDLLHVQDSNGNALFTVGATGNVNVQNAAGNSVLSVDTTNNIVLAAGLQLQSTTGTDLGSWATSPNSLPAPLTNSAYATANGYAYVIGGKNATGTSTGITAASVYYAKLNADGTVGSWTTASNPLPATRKDATAVTANGYIYVIGGDDTNNTMQSTVYYAKLNGDGSVGTWSTATHALPATVGYAASIVANGYVYVMGGSTGFDGGSVVNTVYYAQLNTDGTIGSWTTSSNALPYSPYSPVAVTRGGYAYIMGGWNGSDYDDAYYAKLNSDGTTTSWTPTADLPVALERAQGLVSNDTLYVFGGLNNGPNVNTVYKATFKSDGSIDNWHTESNSLPVATRGMSLAMANGYVYVMGGDVDSGLTAGVYSASLTGGGGVTANSTASNLNLAVGGSIAQSIASDGSVLFQNITNSATAFVVQNAAGVTALNIDTTTNTITLGSVASGNYLTFDSTNGLVAKGSARHTKTILLTPEYAGAVLDASNDPNCTSTNNGTMTAGYDGTNRMNYYDWTSSQSTGQCYDVVVQVPIPSDFDGWVGTPDIEMKKKDSTGTVDYGITVIPSSGSDANYSNYAGSGTLSPAWTNMASNPLSGTYTAGDYMTIKVGMSAANGANVWLGNIKLVYYSKF